MPFKPGQSGNPNGAPKRINTAAQAARNHSEAAIARLVKAMGGDDDNAAIKAANSILDRAWGKPTENVAVFGDDEQPDIRQRILVELVRSTNV